MPSDGKSSHCLWQGELKMRAQLHNNTRLTFLLLLWDASCHTSRNLKWTENFNYNKTKTL